MPGESSDSPSHLDGTPLCQVPGGDDGARGRGRRTRI
jgi:hypothetical protein